LNSLNDFINSIEVVDRQAFKNLSLCFVRTRQMRDLRMKNYDEAIEQKTLLITELDDGGNVPELRFNNKGNMPVFIPEGTIIMGLKQSRTVRISFVINQHEELLVPVHCVEQSRWAFNTKEGHKSTFHIYARLRASNIKHTSDSLREGRGFDSRESQGDTWRNISRRMEKMNIQSDTGFAGDIFENSKEDIDQYIQAFKCPETATGFLAMINGHVIAMDVFASEGLLQRNFQPLLSGVALEAMDAEFNREIQKHKVLTVEQFLRLIENSNKETFNSVGHGEDIRFKSKGIVGSALVTDNKVIHVEAFTEVV
jgi:hypothetical protein